MLKDGDATFLYRLLSLSSPECDGHKELQDNEQHINVIEIEMDSEHATYYREYNRALGRR